MRTLGIVVVIMGVLLTVFSGVTVITQRSSVTVGRLAIDREDKTPVYWSPVAGLLMVASGAVFYLAGGKKFR